MFGLLGAASRSLPLSPATSAQKICRGRRFAVRWRGNHLRIGTRVLVPFCVATDVSRRIVPGLLSPKEHGLLKRLPPARSGGFPPPDFVTNRREDSGACHR